MPHQFPIDRYLNVRAATSPSFSPDGRFVAYLSNTTGHPQVWLIPVTGGEPTQLTFGHDSVRSVHFSPVRHELIFSMDHGGDEHTQLYRLFGIGGNTDHGIGNGWDFENLTNNPKAIHTFGGWSHDGAKIAFAANREQANRFDIYVQDVASGKKKSGEPKLLAKGPGGYYTAAGWSPDDKQLLVIHTDSNVNQDLYLIEVATGKVRHLTPHEGDVQYHSPVWSPDGKTVCCASTHGGRDLAQLAGIDITSGKVTFLGLTEFEIEHVEAPTKGAYLIILENIGGASRIGYQTLLKLALWGDYWVPHSVLTTPTISRDGRWIAVTRDGPRHNPDIWLLDTKDGGGH